MVIRPPADVAAANPTPRSVFATPTASRKLDLRILGFAAATPRRISANVLRADEEFDPFGLGPHSIRRAKKGPDGRIYTQVRTPQGQLVYKSAQEVARAVFAFPGELRSGERHVAALQNGRLRMVPREKVDFELPEMEDAFSPLGNMIANKSMVKGQRAVMAARMVTQALPIIKAEAPLVQSGIPGQQDRSFEQEYAKHMGAMFAEKPARIKSVGPEGITLQYQDGRTETKELYAPSPRAIR